MSAPQLSPLAETDPGAGFAERVEQLRGRENLPKLGAPSWRTQDGWVLMPWTLMADVTALLDWAGRMDGAVRCGVRRDDEHGFTEVRIAGMLLGEPAELVGTTFRQITYAGDDWLVSHELAAGRADLELLRDVAAQERQAQVWWADPQPDPDPAPAAAPAEDIGAAQDEAGDAAALEAAPTTVLPAADDPADRAREVGQVAEGGTP